MKTQKTNNIKGETIVEVLLAITVAAFALGTSFAISNKSLQKSISARERNESTNIVESQIAALKIREQQSDPGLFNNFVSTSLLPANFLHFCLDTTANDKTKTNWLPISNNGQVTATTPLGTSGSPSYAGSPSYGGGYKGCTYTPPGGPTTYYIDIAAMATPSSVSAAPPTVYQFNVRWPAPNSNDTNQLTVYYRF
jgi:hypothetical protein